MRFPPVRLQFEPESSNPQAVPTMKDSFAKWQLSKIDMHGVTEAQLRAAVKRAQLKNFPFVSGSLSFLFMLYALLQWFVLREHQWPVMVVIGWISAALIAGLRIAVQQNRVQLAHINRAYTFVVILVLLSMMLRLFFTGDPKQASNLAFFLVGIGMLLFSSRWFWGLTAVTLTGWLIGIITLPPHDEWIFFSIVILAAAATGSIAQLILTRTFRQSEALRIENAELYRQTRQFNRQLEEKVEERTQELQEAYARLERLDKTKTDFITIASHELRTPLTIVFTNNQILMYDEGIQQNNDYLLRVENIHNGASRIEGVVGSMLDVAKIDSRGLKLRVESVNLSILIRMVSQHFRQALADRHILLQFEGLDAVPEIEADSEGLQKVFYHLLVNAIKYTPDGGKVTVSGYGRSTPNSTESTESPTEVEIIVSDTGIGIDAQVQDLIFEKFYQTGEVMLHSSGKTTFKGGGAGLGLTIVKGIVGAHNGRIWVESPGYDEVACPGSAFHVVLPLNQPT